MIDRDVIADAWALAAREAHGAGVDVQPVETAGVAAAQGVIADAWGNRQIPQSNLLQALSHAGNTVLVAIRDGVAVGVAFGFLGWSGGIHLHSHMTAVSPRVRSQGVGYALKLWQRALCLENGVSEMRWTYDPLIARNAHFNLVKLGADVAAFFPDFYGAMDDEVNAGDHSDRFEVVWRLDSRQVAQALHHTSQPEERPRAMDPLVRVPDDFDAVRRTDPTEARRVRLSSRERFLELFAEGLRPQWAGNGYRFTGQLAESAPIAHPRVAND